jgi:hypothetical protein
MGETGQRALVAWAAAADLSLVAKTLRNHATPARGGQAGGCGASPKGPGHFWPGQVGWAEARYTLRPLR